MEGITIEEFEKMLKEAKKSLGPKAKVMITVPYENGIGWKYEYAINCHAYSGNLDITATLGYKTDAERQAEAAEKFHKTD